eukprot:3683956-Rhodomonas_salina.3
MRKSTARKSTARCPTQTIQQHVRNRTANACRQHGEINSRHPRCQYKLYGARGESHLISQLGGGLSHLRAPRC